MITAKDLEFHHSREDDYTWAETYYIPVSIPEERIFGHVYVCVRPVLGCMQNDVRFIGAMTETEFESLYIDTHFHLPAPKRFSHIQGPNGLSVRAVNPPRDYRIDYVGRDGAELHMDIVGLMNPFDIHDPKENPLAGGTEAERLTRSSMGSGYKGHFDMHGRFSGSLKLRGEEFKIDTVDRMNHSWGPRPEMDIPPNNSLWAQFGEDLGFRFHAHLDPSKPTGKDQRLAHGYVLDKGEAMAIMDLEMTTIRLGITPISIDACVTDQRGRRHHLRGVPMVGAPWRAYGNAICWIGMMQWELNGKVGYGSAQENHSLAFETGARGRRWTDRIPSLAS